MTTGLNSSMSPEERRKFASAYLADRERGRVDLLWLCQNVLGYRDIRGADEGWDDLENLTAGENHQPLLDGLHKFSGREDVYDIETMRVVSSKERVPMYDQKEPDGNRNALFLYPRDHLKTSILTIAHTIQWILNYPDVRILLSFSSGDHGDRIMTAILSHFRYSADFRFWYPEFCPDAARAKDFGSLGNFTVPNRTRQITEPTVMAVSVGKMIAGTHQDVHKHSDLVDKENVKTSAGIRDVIDHFRYTDPLLARVEGKQGWRDVEGTPYDYCLVGETRILMADWSHKNIKEIAPGESVIGWEKNEKGQRVLKPSRVIACGLYEKKPVIKYTMESGRSVTCTKEHNWWKGPWWDHGADSQEYAPLGIAANKLRTLRRLLVPSGRDNSREAGWLAGLYDGEGSFQQNPNHPSGSINMCQSMHNPSVIDEIRRILHDRNFDFWEQWHKPSDKGKLHWKDKCVFNIMGGWRERYRFLVEIAPIRSSKISASLFGQLKTEEDDLVSVEDAGTADVYWFQSETGNYIAEGYCSKNSDLYGDIRDSEAAKSPEKRTWRITERSAEVDVNTHKVLWPKRYTWDALKQIENLVGLFIYMAQYCMKCIAPSGGLATREEIRFIPRARVRELMPQYRIHTTIDSAGVEEKANGDYWSFCTAGFLPSGYIHIIDIRHGHFTAFQAIQQFFSIHEQFRPMDFKMEKTQHAQMIEPFLRQEMQKRGTFLNVLNIPRSNQVSKKNRIFGVQPFFAAKRLLFADDIPAIGHLIMEITRFPKFRYDDILDTIADQLQHADGKGIESDLYPAHQEAQEDPMAMMGMQTFLGFDPETKAAIFGGGHQFDDQSEYYHERTGL
jgi:hypothetical protein